MKILITRKIFFIVIALEGIIGLSATCPVLIERGIEGLYDGTLAVTASSSIDGGYWMDPIASVSKCLSSVLYGVCVRPPVGAQRVWRDVLTSIDVRTSRQTQRRLCYSTFIYVLRLSSYRFSWTSV